MTTYEITHSLLFMNRQLKLYPLLMMGKGRCLSLQGSGALIHGWDIVEAENPNLILAASSVAQGGQKVSYHGVGQEGYKVMFHKGRWK